MANKSERQGEDRRNADKTANTLTYWHMRRYNTVHKMFYPSCAEAAMSCHKVVATYVICRS